MAQIRYLKNKQDEIFFPVVHEKGVIDSNGENLENKIGLKQPILVSGVNIKTINNASILGPGNINVHADASLCEQKENKVTSLSSSNTHIQYPSAKAVFDALGNKVNSDDINYIVELTQAEFNALSVKREDTMYIITDSTVPSDRVGIASLEQTTVSTQDNGINIWTVTLTNNQTFQLAVRNGSQGNSGYTGAAGELEVVNNDTQGGTTAAWSAERGKEIRKDMLSANASLSLSKFKSMSVTVDAIGSYIYASTGNWATSSAADSYMLPIVPGKKYYVKAYGIRDGRIAVLTTDEHTTGTTPSYADGFESYINISASEGYLFTAPYNAAYLNITSKLSSNSVRPSFIMEEMGVEESIEAATKSCVNVSGCPSRYVDANPESTTFGMSVAATNSDWGASDLIYVRGYKKVRYHTVIFSTSTNYADKAGDVFFDENFQPISDGVRIVQKAGNAAQRWIDTDIPDNAYYFRRTYVTTAGTPVETYLISDSNSGSFEYTDSIAQKDYVYYGQKIDLGNSLNYTRFATNGTANTQAAASYGDYLFMLKANMTSVILYNLKKRTTLFTLAPELTSESHWHCNQASFSPNFYDSNDMFPVLYVSMQNNSEGRCEAHGYRIIPSYTDGEISSFSIQLVQKIFLPVMNDINCLGNANVTFDVQKGWMWTYSRNKNDQASNNGQARFTRFAIPDLELETVTLEDSDIVEAFSDDFNMALAQGGFIHNGKLIILQGYASAGYINCHVVDLYLEKKRVSWIDMLSDGFRMEPEGAFWYDGKIHLTTATVNMYRIDL